MVKTKVTKPKSYKPSKYQLAIYDFVEHGQGNGVISASAGSGKTYTIIKSLDYIKPDKKVLIVAFNRDIRQEIKKKVEESGHNNVQVETFHSLGYKILNANYNNKFSKQSPNERKYINYIYTCIAQLSTINTYRLGKLFNQYISNISNLVNYGRCYLSQTVEDLEKVCERYGIDCIADEKEVTIKVLEWGKTNLNEIDFGDMVWLPNALYLDSKFYKYDWIIVDECQDLNMIEKDMLFTCRKMGTRMLFFGDKAQAIYSFSGADSEAFDKLIEMEDTTPFPLSISYRCPKKIVEYVHHLVPTIEHNKKNKTEGQVLENVSLTAVQDGDMVLCRNNAPLAQVYVELLRAGKKAKILGKDFSSNLVRVINGTKEKDLNLTLNKQGVFSKLYDTLFDLLRETVRKQNIKEEEALSNPTISSKIDEIKVLEVLSYDINTATELVERVKSIFVDNKEKGITLSTIHKSKGLEAPNVYIVCKSLLPSKTAKRKWEIEQEENLMYVAYTRTKNILGFLDEKEFKGFDTFNPETINTLKTKRMMVDYLYGKDRNKISTIEQAREIIESATTIDHSSILNGRTKNEFVISNNTQPQNAIDAFGSLIKRKKTRVIRRVKK